MSKHLLSRRHLMISSLAGCSALIAGIALPFSEEPPPGYIRPGPITGRGKAPGLKTRLLFPDGSTKGGHVIGATAWPTLELFLTDEPTSLVKEEDPETGLYLFDPKA